MDAKRRAQKAKWIDKAIRHLRSSDCELWAAEAERELLALLDADERLEQAETFFRAMPNVLADSGRDEYIAWSQNVAKNYFLRGSHD